MCVVCITCPALALLQVRLWCLLLQQKGIRALTARDAIARACCAAPGHPTALCAGVTADEEDSGFIDDRDEDEINAEAAAATAAEPREQLIQGQYGDSDGEFEAGPPTAGVNGVSGVGSRRVGAARAAAAREGEEEQEEEDEEQNAKQRELQEHEESDGNAAADDEDNVPLGEQDMEDIRVTWLANAKPELQLRKYLMYLLLCKLDDALHTNYKVRQGGG